MNLVKVKRSFFQEAVDRGTNTELMLSDAGRPCVLILKLKYKDVDRKFCVPLRSNISSTTPGEQFLSLPPNPKTKPGNHHGVHYIKLFPIDDKYIDTFLTAGDAFLTMIKGIIDSKEKEIVDACQTYLNEVSVGNKNPFTPDIDGILSWL